MYYSPNAVSTYGHKIYIAQQEVKPNSVPTPHCYTVQLPVGRKVCVVRGAELTDT